MLNQIKQRLQNRQHAGRLLAEKLLSFKSSLSHPIVLAIPQGGIPVGHEVAAILGAPFEIVFSKRIKHPAHSDQSIGAVSMDEVMLHETTQFIPQSYVLNQIAMLQRTLQEQFRRYYGNKNRKSLSNRSVILVDDVLRDVDELTACLHLIERQSPEKIIVAAPIVSIKVLNYLSEEDIDCCHLFTEFSQQSKAYTYFPELSEDETRDIFNSSNEYLMTSGI
jgi:putative phosphoribosyl transferase